MNQKPVKPHKHKSKWSLLFSRFPISQLGIAGKGENRITAELVLMRVCLFFPTPFLPLPNNALIGAFGKEEGKREKGINAFESLSPFCACEKFYEH